MRCSSDRQSSRLGALVVVALCLLPACNVAGDRDLDPSIDLTGALHTVGSSTSIANVVDVEVLDDGSIWVLNSTEPFLVGLGPDGASLGEYGTRGGGPEDFGAPAGFVIDSARTSAWVLDVRRNVLVEVPRREASRVEFALPRDSIPLGSLQPGMGMMSSGVRSARVGDDVIVPRSFGTLRAGVYSFWSSVWGADLVAVGPSGIARPVLSLSSVLGDPTTFLQQTNGFPPVPLWFRLWTVCDDGLIRVHDRMANAIRGFSLDGQELESIALPAPRFSEVTDEQFARAVFGLAEAEATGRVGGRLSASDSAQLMERVVEGVEGTPDLLARFLPRFVDLRCAADRSLWLRPIDLDRSDLRGSDDWIRVRPDGVARLVRFPPRFDAYRFLSGRVLGVQRDEFDVATVAWVDLPTLD
jgi:hypothetical protein